MSVFLETPMERAANRWEHGVLHPMDARKLDLPTVRAVVAHAFGLLGLPKRPPVVEQVGRDQPGYISGALAAVSNDGLHMRLFTPVNTVTVLHEVAHLATDDPLDAMELRPLAEREMHGAMFRTNFLWLLDRLMGPSFNTFHLRATMPALLTPAALPYHPVGWAQTRA